MDDSSFEDVRSTQEVGDDMLLSYYQMDAKSKALAQRAPS